MFLSPVKMSLCHRSPPKTGDVFAVSKLGDSKQIGIWEITVESQLLILMAPLVCHRSF